MSKQTDDVCEVPAEKRQDNDGRVKADLIAAISEWGGKGWPTHSEIADELNRRGSTSRTGLPWTTRLVKYALMDYGIRKMELRPDPTLKETE
jgi:hypothetical protein